MAIHPIAGNPTSGGAVQGELPALMDVATDGGGDRRGIADPVLIGHDGIRCAGRPGAELAGRREAAGGRPVAGPRATAGSGGMGSRTTDLPPG